MADETDDNKKPAALPGVLPMKMVIILAVGVLVLGIGGAIAFMSMTKGHDKTDQAAEHAGEAKSAGKEAGDGGQKSAKDGPGPIFDLDPFVVNLADPSDSHYLKVTMKLELERADTAEQLTQRTPQVRDAVLILLSSKDSASIRTAQGKLQLREDLIRKVNSLLPKGGVRGAYFTEFIVQ